MKVAIPTPLHSYTGGRAEIEVQAAHGRALMEALEREFPGLPFRIVDEQGRIRPHIQIFRDGKLLHDLDASLRGAQRVTIVAALSGG